MFVNVLCVGCGGFIGASLRYLVTFFVSSTWYGAWPLATFLINLVGCFCMGLFSTCIPVLFPENNKALLFGTTGLLGGFTTLSTFGLETLGLVQEDNYLMAGGYIAATLAVCLFGVALGRMAGRAIFNN